MSTVNAAIYRQRFLAIVDEVRSALGYALRDYDPDPGEALAMEMMYGNFEFAVVHSHRFSPSKVLVECQFGEIPVAQKEEILRQVLRMNSVLAELDGSVFSIDETSGKLVYMLPLRMDSLTGMRLISKMTEITWHGRKWLETRFFPDRIIDSASVPSPVFLA